ncbi:corticoliberin [Zootoca vivipara]|uniref:corticoliberin n=1 Tax=Zootoca vivipara TaxID=8524 RepID=UPI0015900088|nr:corticoliberin [Zootoca vivipara]
MKIQLLVSTGILLVALLPCNECRAFSKSVPADSALQQPDLLQEQPQALPILLRVGEEYFVRLGNLHKNPSPAAFSFSSSSASGGSHLAASASAGNFFRAAVQQLQNVRERSLEGAAEPWPSDNDGGAPLDAAPKEKRTSKDSPISIDLTFHLLRQLLEMARADQMSQQIESNRKMLETIGK